MKTLLRTLVRTYQLAFSPLLSFVCGPECGCRFQPSCSHYFLEAVDVHGARRGALMGLWRIARCQPWGGSGLDPVPPARNGTSVERGG